MVISLSTRRLKSSDDMTKGINTAQNLGEKFGDLLLMNSGRLDDKFVFLAKTKRILAVEAVIAGTWGTGPWAMLAGEGGMGATHPTGFVWRRIGRMVLAEPTEEGKR